jgi:hypothetical protein
MSIQWARESDTHATSTDTRYTVWKWYEGCWISECVGKAKTHTSKAEAKQYCENHHKQAR